MRDRLWVRFGVKIFVEAFYQECSATVVWRNKASDACTFTLRGLFVEKCFQGERVWNGAPPTWELQVACLARGKGEHSCYANFNPIFI